MSNNVIKVNNATLIIITTTSATALTTSNVVGLLYNRDIKHSY